MNKYKKNVVLAVSGVFLAVTANASDFRLNPVDLSDPIERQLMLADQDETFMEGVSGYTSYLGSQMSGIRASDMMGRGLTGQSIALVACCSLAVLAPPAEGKSWVQKLGKKAVRETRRVGRQIRGKSKQNAADLTVLAAAAGMCAIPGSTCNVEPMPKL